MAKQSSNSKPAEQPDIEALMLANMDAANKLFDDPVEALRVLAGHYYLESLRKSGFTGPLTDVMFKHLPYARQLADLGNEETWDLRQLQAAESLEAFVTISKADYEATAHQRLICREVQRVVDAPDGRLYIGVPPRHGKSEIASIRLAAWQLGRDPSTRILLICNTQQLADTFSRQCRDLVFGDPIYRRLFSNVLPDPARQAASEWRTAEGGGMKAVGAGVTISGHGADLIIIDDPHGDEDWQNPQQLERVYEWYTSSVRTRLQPASSIVLLMTRWHVNDIVGRLLALPELEPEADRFDSIVLRAIAGVDDPLGRPEGAALWPERFGLDRLAKQRAQSEQWFEAQYQQNPVAFSDYVFRREWIARAPMIELAEGDRVFWTADLAITDSQRSDYNVLALWTVKDGKLWLLDHRRFRGTIDLTLRIVAELTELYGAGEMYTPEDVVENIARPILRREFKGWTFPTHALQGDKRAKAQTAAALMSAGRVVFCEGHPGLDKFIEEVLAFPNGLHDDCVDVLSLAAHLSRGWSGMRVGDKNDEPEVQLFIGGKSIP